MTSPTHDKEWKISRRDENAKVSLYTIANRQLLIPDDFIDQLHRDAGISAVNDYCKELDKLCFAKMKLNVNADNKFVFTDREKLIFEEGLSQGHSLASDNNYEAKIKEAEDYFWKQTTGKSRLALLLKEARADSLRDVMQFVDAMPVLGNDKHGFSLIRYADVVDYIGNKLGEQPVENKVNCSCGRTDVHFHGVEERK